MLVAKMDIMLLGLCFGSGKLSMKSQTRTSVSAVGIVQK